MGRIDSEEANALAETLKGAFDSTPLKGAKVCEAEVFELTSKEGLTVHDAAYLYIAMKDGLTLVSGDERLLSKATRYVKSLRMAGLLCR